jgi:D-tyrosyl-tRNA(Tyr) deacylase
LEDRVIALIQRVSKAHVEVEGRSVARIDCGLVAFVAVERGDAQCQVGRMLERVSGYRVFSDAQAKMNLSVTDIAGELLLVPQFTLAADTRKGMRPSFSGAASPEHGERLFTLLVSRARERMAKRVASGLFGAHMRVHLINDGPVTFWLRAAPGGDGMGER